MLMSELINGELINDHSGYNQECFACQNYKLTCQYENTISPVFIILQSNNTLKVKTLTNFENWRGGGGGTRESLVGVGAATPAPPLATALQYIVLYDACIPNSQWSSHLHVSTKYSSIFTVQYIISTRMSPLFFFSLHV